MNEFKVFPRYSGGSPAMVDCRQAERITKQEKEAHKAALEGVYGQEEKERAERLGLDGIVLAVKVKASSWQYVDYITGKKYEDVPTLVFRRDPRTLIVRQEKSKNKYYFLRELIATEPVLFSQPYRVLKALMLRFELTEQEAWEIYDSRIYC